MSYVYTLSDDSIREILVLLDVVDIVRFFETYNDLLYIQENKQFLQKLSVIHNVPTVIYDYSNINLIQQSETICSFAPSHSYIEIRSDLFKIYNYNIFNVNNNFTVFLIYQYCKSIHGEH